MRHFLLVTAAVAGNFSSLRLASFPVVARNDANAIHADGAGDHLPPRLAAGMDRDHRHLHADLHPTPGALQHRSTLLRFACGPEPPDGVPLAAGRDGRLLSEGGGAAARDAQPDLHRDDAVHGDPVFGDIFTLSLPADRPVGAELGVPLMIPASARSRSGGVPNHYNLNQEEEDATFFVRDRHRPW